MSFFIHAADVHLDSPLKGLGQDEHFHGADTIRNATRQALIHLVDLCLEKKAPLLLLAGDIYDGNWKDFSTGLFFAGQMQRLADKNIMVALIRGNHDAANKMTRSLVLPENVHVFSEKQPETWLIDELGIAIHGQSYDRQDVTRNLVPSYPDPVEGYTNIGLLHCLLTGSASGHQPYAPCTVEDLINKGYDYWALGHVHQFQQVNDFPPIIYSGCLQGRHIKETGPKGCAIVDLSDDISPVTFYPLDKVRWQQISVSLEEIDSYEEVYTSLEHELLTLESEYSGTICLRIAFTGSCSIHGELLRDPESLLANTRSTAMKVLGSKTLVQKIDIKTSSQVDIEALIQSDTPQGEMLRLIAQLPRDTWEQELDLDISQLRAKTRPVSIHPELRPDLLAKSRDLLLAELSQLQADEK